jgi:hypothetical protein
MLTTLFSLSFLFLSFLSASAKRSRHLMSASSKPVTEADNDAAAPQSPEASSSPNSYQIGLPDQPASAEANSDSDSSQVPSDQGDREQ